MYQKTKASLAVLLIGLLLYNSIGYIMVVPLWQMAHRSKIIASMPLVDTSRLVEIIVAKDDSSIIYKDGKREILFEGMMYDIVLTRSTGTKISHLCLPDPKENRVLSLSGKMHGSHRKHQESTPLSRIILEHIIKCAILSAVDPSNTVEPVAPLIGHFCSSSYTDPSIWVPEHPPRS